jgi:hypothetical protein
MRNYEYEPLDHARCQIRILTLFASPDFDSSLQGRLRVVDLDSNPTYKALSYVWSTEPQLQPLLDIDGFFCDISIHLANILKHLRQPDAVEDLWIDAICIDQSNFEERGHQVAMMRDIYGKCMTDLVWLEDPLNEMLFTEEEGQETSSSEEDEASLEDEDARELPRKDLRQNYKDFNAWRRDLPNVDVGNDHGGEEDEVENGDDYNEQLELLRWTENVSSRNRAATIEQGLSYIKRANKLGITLADFGGNDVAPRRELILKPSLRLACGPEFGSYKNWLVPWMFYS